METERPGDDVHGEVERGQRDKPWQRYLDAALGLRNYWYPVLFSHELQEGATRPETLLGERLFSSASTVKCTASKTAAYTAGVPSRRVPSVTRRTH